MASNPAIERYGWTAVPRSIETLLAQSQAGLGEARAFTVEEMQVPASVLATRVQQYAKEELSIQTYHHSMRVYYYGQAILQHAFPTWASSSFDETYFLTCMLHDIGTTDENTAATLMSFEFFGGLVSLSLLQSYASPRAQAENVAEAIIRHQDLGCTGTITRVGALIQLATILDNMGWNKQLVHRATIESVVGEWPRVGWSSCFEKTIRRENATKPWAHTTHLGEDAFPDGVRNNELMAPYDAR